MSCGVDCRSGSDPPLLWLWRRPAATVPIGPLAWEHPYAVGSALEKAKRQKKKKKKKFSTSTPALVISNSHPNGYEVMSHCGFNFSFP